MAKSSDRVLVNLSAGPNPMVLDARTLASTRGLIQGSSGSGKSMLARLMGESVADRMPLIIIDPEGEYCTMREVCSMVLVGGGGEIRIDPSTAGRVARGLLKESCSAIIDLSDLPHRDHNRYVGSFIDAMMHSPRSCWRPTLVFIDEAHRFCPEGGNKKSAESSDAIKDLMSRGRKRGYGGVLLTQRISKVSKDAIGEAGNQFFGITYQDLDIKRTADTLGMSPKDAQVFRKLERGEWFAHGPALNHQGVGRFQAMLPGTDSPNTNGTTQPPVKNANAVKRLALSVEEAISSSDGPITLEEAEQTIAALRAELKSASNKSKSVPGPDSQAVARLEHQLRDSQRIQADVVADRDRVVFEARRIVEKLVEEHESIVSGVTRLVTARPGPGKGALDMLGKLSASAKPSTAPKPAVRSVAVPGMVPGPAGAVGIVGAATRSDTPSVRSPQMNGSAEERMLAAIAWWRAAGLNQPSPSQIGLVAGISSKSSTFRSARASLRQRGLVDYHGKLTGLTADGLIAVEDFMPSPTMSQWHRMIREQIGSGAALRAFDHLVLVGSCSKSDLAEACEISVESSTIRSAIAALRNLGLVAKGQPIRATELMRPSHLS